MDFKNDLIPYAFNSEIVEWDIESGNTSIMEYFQILPKKRIDRVRAMEKEQRLIQIGLILRKHPEYKKPLESGFDTMVNLFIEQNRLDRDRDIIAIKKDAVYVKNHVIQVSDFPPSVHFRPKKVYHAFIRLDHYELYISNTSIDVKGISDENLVLHQNGMLKLIREVTELMEQGDRYGLNEYLHSVASAYKKRELDIDWYREFSPNSTFQYHDPIDGFDISFAEIEEDQLPDVDISYNYKKLILPLIQLLC